MDIFPVDTRQEALILAGGRGSRLPDKCFKTLGNKELILYVFEKISISTRKIVVAVKNSEQANRLSVLLPSVQIVLDEVSDQTPLAGFLSGLRAIGSQYVFVAPCDTPFIEPGVIQLLFQRALGNDGAVVMIDSGMLEPLCAVYRRETALRAAQKAIQSRRTSMLDVLAQFTKIVRVHSEELRKVDPQLLTFRNINTNEDLAWAERMIRTHDATHS